MRERDIFAAAREIAEPAARSAFLARACGGDAGIKARVEVLLRAEDRPDSLLDRPPLEPVASDTLALEHEADATTVDDAALRFLGQAGRPDSLGRIGHYEVLQVLGQGAFGIVFRAFDDMLHRAVAVKVLSSELAATSPARRRFLREARSSAQVRHENVVQVYEVGERPLPYLVMELIPGETLQQRLDRAGPLDVPEVLRIGRQVAEGLAAAHALDLIHRDIKPGNVLLEGGTHRVKITDFGLARAADDASISQSGIIAGTPMYMAPEQARGDRIDQRADLFSLGSVLYTMVTGRQPFRASGTLAVLKRVAEGTPRPIREIIPETPQWLCDIIAKLHAKRADDRFQSAREVADLLGRCLAEIPLPGAIPDLSGLVSASSATAPPGLDPPEAAPATASRPPRSRPHRWVAAAVVLAAVSGGFGLAEATGTSDVRGTLIRLFSPEGTLVVEVDDPGVVVSIDGSELVISGAGVQEIRLKPGAHTVQARKAGKSVPVIPELVTVARNGRQIVRVSREARPGEATPAPAAAAVEPPDAALAAARATDAAAWERSVSGLPAVERAKAVALRLEQLNPGFDGTIIPTIENGVVTGLELNIDRITDIAPIRAFTGLTSLACHGSDAFKGQFVDGMRSTGYERGRVQIKSVGKSRFVDLSPLRGLPLTSLSCSNCNVYDLTPLKGMELKSLHLRSTLVFDLSPLKEMPLDDLDFSYTKVADISPLQGMKLTRVAFELTDVFDLTPLKGMALRLLKVGRKVTDLTPISGLPLEELTCFETGVTDLSPLKGMPLKLLNCERTPVSDLAPLRGIPLSRLNLGRTKVSDLAPLRGMRLVNLSIHDTGVSDLSPLEGMPLQELNCRGSKVTDLSPLKGMPLTWLFCDLQPARDAGIVRGLSTLKTINDRPAAEFWREVDEQAGPR
ncbi:MAG: protein kinase [Isosphaeraceae bacterium]